MDYQTQLFINGEFVDAADGATIDLVNPYDNSKIGDLAEAKAADVDRAVAAAKAALPAWSKMAAADRGRLLLKLADAIEERAEDFARLESIDTGHPLRDTRLLDVPRTVVGYRYFGGMADKLQGDVIPVEQGFLNYTQREPLGVVGSIVPWNFPLMFTSWKLGPALAAGNTIVLKPSELTPLSSLKIAALMTEIGIPPGVVNIIPGYGHSAGAHLAQHPDVAKIAFTGSTHVGRKIIEYSATNIKKVQMELGGKGANIVFDDANIAAAVNGSAFAIFHNQGQACIAGSRLLLHERIADEFLNRFVTLAKSIKLGDPLDPATEMGPLTSVQHLQRVLSYCDVAREEGGEILIGGRQPEADHLSKGCFVEPTIVRAEHGSRVTLEEVFGPFVTVSTFKTEEQALEMANSTEYGLGGGLWTQNLSRAHRFAKAMKSGMIWINCYKRVNPGSPFGGMKQSGYGREMGFEVMREYTQVKSVWVNVDAQIPPYYPRPQKDA